MKSFLSVRPARLEPDPGREIRIFESETAEILEAPQPIQTRGIMLFVLTGLFISLVLA